MTSKSKILIGLIILLIAGITFLISTMLKPAGSDLAKGTFGKAEKYHKQAMTERDVQLRSEFTKDTVQLRNMIQGLKYFGQFNEKVAWQIDTMMSLLRFHPLVTDKAMNPPFMALKDYSTFLAANGQHITSTEIMLQQFVTGEEAIDQSVDIEKNLRVLGNFMNQVALRDSVLEEAAMRIDLYLDKASRKKLMQEEITNLKSFRDMLLVDNLLTAAMLGEKSTLARITKYLDEEDERQNLLAATGELHSISEGISANDFLDATPRIRSQEASLGNGIIVGSYESVQSAPTLTYVESLQIEPILNFQESVQSIPVYQVIDYINSIPVTQGMQTLDIRTGLPPLNIAPIIEGVTSIKSQLQGVGCLTGWDFLY